MQSFFERWSLVLFFFAQANRGHLEKLIILYCFDGQVAENIRRFVDISGNERRVELICSVSLVFVKDKAVL